MDATTRTLQGESIMILLTIAIIFCILLLTVEIPTYIRMRDTTDLEIVIVAWLMLAGSIAVLYWR